MKPKNKARRLPAIGIKWKLFAYLAAFAAVILIILWLCQVVFLGDIYRTIKTAEIKNAASELSRIVNDTDRLSEAVETVSRKNDVCILVLKMLSKETAFKLVSCDAVKNCT